MLIRIAAATLCSFVAILFGGDRVQAQAPPAQEPTKTATYVLRQGDEITIKVFEQPDLLENLAIRPDGRISVLLLDDIQAAGLTTTELDAELTAGYAKYFTNPQVSVIVRRFVNQRIFVGGEVGAPGAVPLVGEMRAIEAVFQAGGFRPTARLDSVILVRNDGHDHPVVQKLNFKDTLAKGTDITLKPFDVLYVPLSRIAKADKFIDQYIRQLLPITLTAGFTYVLGDAVAVLPK